VPRVRPIAAPCINCKVFRAAGRNQGTRILKSRAEGIFAKIPLASQTEVLTLFEESVERSFAPSDATRTRGKLRSELPELPDERWRARASSASFAFFNAASRADNHRRRVSVDFNGKHAEVTTVQWDKESHAAGSIDIYRDITR